MYRNDPDYTCPPDNDGDVDNAFTCYLDSPEYDLDKKRAAFLGRRVAECLTDAVQLGMPLSPRAALQIAKDEWEGLHNAP